MEERGIFDHAARVSETFQARLAQVAAHPIVGEARGKGLMGAVEMVADKETKQPFDAGLGIGPYCMQRAMDHGLIVRGLGDSVAICPPLIITDAQVHELFDKLDKAHWTRRSSTLGKGG